MDIESIIHNTKASQNKDELRFVYDEVSEIAPQVIVEIGSWRGDLLHTFDELFHPKLLIGMEKDASVFDGANDKYTWINKDSSDPATLEVLKTLLLGEQIDYLFIDGDHMYSAVKKDFEMYAPLVRDGGIVGFHDVALFGKNADGHEWESLGVQVNRYWKELTKLYEHKMLKGEPSGSGTGLIFL